MAIYHPPKMITNNAAPILSADLAYEGHGKCGQTRVLNSSLHATNGHIFDANIEGTSNAWKMVVTRVGRIDSRSCCSVGGLRHFNAENMSIVDSSKLCGDFTEPFEIMGDISYVELDGNHLDTTVILYLDCEQS